MDRKRPRIESRLDSSGRRPDVAASPERRPKLARREDRDDHPLANLPASLRGRVTLLDGDPRGSDPRYRPRSADKHSPWSAERDMEQHHSRDRPAERDTRHVERGRDENHPTDRDKPVPRDRDRPADRDSNRPAGLRDRSRTAERDRDRDRPAAWQPAPTRDRDRDREPGRGVRDGDRDSHRDKELGRSVRDGDRDRDRQPAPDLSRDRRADASRGRHTEQQWDSNRAVSAGRRELEVDRERASRYDMNSGQHQRKLAATSAAAGAHGREADRSSRPAAFHKRPAPSDYGHGLEGDKQYDSRDKQHLAERDRPAGKDSVRSSSRPRERMPPRRHVRPEARPQPEQRAAGTAGGRAEERHSRRNASHDRVPTAAEGAGEAAGKGRAEQHAAAVHQQQEEQPLQAEQSDEGHQEHLQEESQESGDDGELYEGMDHTQVQQDSQQQEQHCDEGALLDQHYQQEQQEHDQQQQQYLGEDAAAPSEGVASPDDGHAAAAAGRVKHQPIQFTLAERRDLSVADLQPRLSSKYGMPTTDQPAAGEQQHQQQRDVQPLSSSSAHRHSDRENSASSHGRERRQHAEVQEHRGQSEWRPDTARGSRERSRRSPSNERSRRSSSKEVCARVEAQPSGMKSPASDHAGRQARAWQHDQPPSTQAGDRHAANEEHEHHHRGPSPGSSRWPGSPRAPAATAAAAAAAGGGASIDAAGTPSQRPPSVTPSSKAHEPASQQGLRAAQQRQAHQQQLPLLPSSPLSQPQPAGVFAPSMPPEVEQVLLSLRRRRVGLVAWQMRGLPLSRQLTYKEVWARSCQAARLPPELVDGSLVALQRRSAAARGLAGRVAGPLLPPVHPSVPVVLEGQAEEAHIQHLQQVIDSMAAQDAAPYCVALPDGGSMLLPAELQGVLW